MHYKKQNTCSIYLDFPYHRLYYTHLTQVEYSGNKYQSIVRHRCNNYYNSYKLYTNALNMYHYIEKYWQRKSANYVQKYKRAEKLPLKDRSY